MARCRRSAPMTNAVQIPAQKNHRQRLGARRAQIQPPRHRSAAGASRTVLLDCGVPGFTPSRANRCSSSWILKVIRRCLQGFGSWGEVFGDRVIATAILDRRSCITRSPSTSGAIHIGSKRSSKPASSGGFRGCAASAADDQGGDRENDDGDPALGFRKSPASVHKILASGRGGRFDD